MQLIDAQMQISVSLAAEQWNQTLAVLGEGPYRVVAPIIQDIGQQLQAAAQEAQPKPNGQADMVRHIGGPA